MYNFFKKTILIFYIFFILLWKYIKILGTLNWIAFTIYFLDHYYKTLLSGIISIVRY